MPVVEKIIKLTDVIAITAISTVKHGPVNKITYVKDGEIFWEYTATIVRMLNYIMLTPVKV